MVPARPVRPILRGRGENERSARGFDFDSVRKRVELGRRGYLPMNVILAVVGEIVVDNVLNVLDTVREKEEGGEERSATVSTRRRRERGGRRKEG